MKALRLSLFFLLGLFIISCGESFLDSYPTDQFSSATFWKTKQHADMALAGAYRGWEDGLMILRRDEMTDNGYNHLHLVGISNVANGTVNPDNVGGDVIRAFSYSRIRKYNDFLENIDNVEMDEALKERYKAEVRFLRAYDYFQKVEYFGDMPLVIRTLAPDEFVGRDPASQIREFILSELAEIAEILPVQNMRQSNGHVTSGSAMALKARMELFMGRYEDAMKSAQAVIDMGVYELYPDYEGLFNPDNEANNNESILEIQYLSDVYSTSIPWQRNPAFMGGYAEAGVLKGMIDAYETGNGLPITEDATYDPDNPFANRDPRLKMSVVVPGTIYGGRYYSSLDPVITNADGTTSSNPDYHLNDGSKAGQWPKKYLTENRRPEHDQNYGANIMLIRLAEMYLTYAEAAVETGQNLDLALEYINKLRKRAGHTEATELTRELVRRERRVELAFEGLRWYDIKRWDIGPEVMNGPAYGSRVGSVNFQTGEVTWGDGYILLENRIFYPERNYLMPIPQREIDVNPNMTQNTGYN